MKSMKNDNIKSQLESLYPHGILVCPVCGKEFEADDNTRYIINGGYTCSKKCFLTESKKRKDEKNAVEKKKIER